MFWIGLAMLVWDWSAHVAGIALGYDGLPTAYPWPYRAIFPSREMYDLFWSCWHGTSIALMLGGYVSANRATSVGRGVLICAGTVAVIMAATTIINATHDWRTSG